MTSAVFSFLHFAAVFGIVATLAIEAAVLSAAPTWRDARLLQRCDRWYGISALAILVVGFLRVLFFEKGPAYYFGNPFFHAKLTLFVVIGLLSIYPTIRFIKWRHWTREGQAPVVSTGEFRLIRGVLYAEAVLLLGVVLCAALMARGVTL
jgi:putative membrane protein